MSRAYNFSAGPATLPEPVLRQAQAEMLEFGNAGASVVELSHRGPEFIAVAQQTEADLRTLLSIPDDYAVIFTAGGATTIQALLPLNFAEAGQAVDYVVTGHWGKTAVRQAQPYAAVNIAASSEADGYRQILTRNRICLRVPQYRETGLHMTHPNGLRVGIGLDVAAQTAIRATLRRNSGGRLLRVSTRWSIL